MKQAWAASNLSLFLRATMHPPRVCVLYLVEVALEVELAEGGAQALVRPGLEVGVRVLQRQQVDRAWGHKTEGHQAGSRGLIPQLFKGRLAGSHTGHAPNSCFSIEAWRRPYDPSLWIDMKLRMG